MKRFAETSFFLLLKKDNYIQMSTLDCAYNEFATLLFAEGAASTNKAAYHNTLVYTRVELVYLTKEVSKKKCGNRTAKSHSTY